MDVSAYKPTVSFRIQLPSVTLDKRQESVKKYPFNIFIGQTVVKEPGAVFFCFINYSADI